MAGRQAAWVRERGRGLMPTILAMAEFVTVQKAPVNNHKEGIRALETGRADVDAPDRSILMGSRRWPAKTEAIRARELQVLVRALPAAGMTRTSRRGGTMRVRVRASGWLGTWLCVAAVL